MLNIRDPLTIVGDIHGQYYDLQNILEKTNLTGTNKNKLLFMGDYVDRGNFSIQVILIILSLKINHPKYVYLLRGNHQCRQLTTYFNFRNQCLDTYNQQIYEEFLDLFNSLPLAALINHSMLCIHGGISTNFRNIEDIMKIDRFQQIAKQGLFCDLLWADPIDNQSGDLNTLTIFNQDRNCSYNFGWQLAQQVIANNKLKCIIRAHEAKQQGFQMHHWAGKNCFPPIITIFSAPNYCDFYNNRGAILNLKRNQLQVIQYEARQHPFYLPGDQTLFEWSVPFLAEKVSEIFYSLLHGSIIDDSYKNIEQAKGQQNQQINVMIIDRAKMIQELLNLQMQEVEESLHVMRVFTIGKTLGQELANNKQAREYMTDFKNKQKDFEKQKQIDRINERRPSVDLDE